MDLWVEPPLDQWRPKPAPLQSRTDLARLVNQTSSRLGAAALENTATLLATGHQAWWWHPGILAKDLAMAAAAQCRQAGRFHLVVDHDIHEAMRLDLPLRQGNRLEALNLRLTSERLGVPAGCQPPADADAVRRTLKATRVRWGADLLVDLEPFIDAWSHLPPVDSLADQVMAVLLRLMEPYTGPMPLLRSTDLQWLPSFVPLVQRLLADARRCAQIYNRAVARHPQARMAPLIVELDRVELPLWALPWDQPRRRIFADVADSRPQLVDENGQTIALATQGLSLAPRALLLTAMLRSEACDLFIHGKGGGVYDQITGEWWHEWTGEELAPMCVVSADLRMEFDVPLATPQQLRHAIWQAHHLPHNLDRALSAPADGPVSERAREKRQILASMNADRDPAHRAEAFHKLHHINAELAQRRPELLAQAKRELDQARAGVANQAIARRRDWCFALYPPHQLQSLATALQATPHSAPLQSGT